LSIGGGRTHSEIPQPRDAVHKPGTGSDYLYSSNCKSKQMTIQRQVTKLRSTLCSVRQPFGETTRSADWRDEMEISLEDAKSLVQFRKSQAFVTPKTAAARKPNVIDVDLQLEFLKHKRVNLSLDLSPDIRTAGDSWFR